MSKFQEELLLLLGGVAFAVGGAVGLFYLDGWNFAKAACACLAGTVVTVGMAWCIHRDWKNGTLFPKVVTAKERKQGTELPLELPWSQLEVRFRKLALCDDTVEAHEPPGFLGRAEGTPLNIFHSGGEDWLALYWFADGNHLRPSELAALCRRHHFPLPEETRKMKPTGVAFYREGTLTLYPAAFEVEFRRRFLENSLATEAEFRQRAREIYDEEGREWSRLP